MANIHNAVSDAMEELNMTEAVRSTIIQDPNNQRRWLITFESHPGSLIYSKLYVEILELPDAGGIAGCVLERRNVNRSRMNLLMDTLIDHLEYPPVIPDPEAYPQQPPAGGPPSPR